MYMKGRYELYFSGKNMCMSVLDIPTQDLVIDLKSGDNLTNILYRILTYTDKHKMIKFYSKKDAPKQSLWWIKK